MGIDVRVFGDPAGLRQTGMWLAGLSTSLGSVGDAVSAARGTSEHAWTGPAGDAFRGHLSRMLPNIDDLEKATTGLAWTFTQLASQIEAVQASMANATAIALRGGLVVTGGFIAEPIDPAGATGIPIVDLGTGASTIDPAAAAAFAAAAAAFAQVKTIVADARAVEVGAHQDLNARIQNWMTVMDQATSGAGWLTGWELAGGVATYLNTAAHGYSSWAEVAEMRAAQLARFTSIAGEAGAPVSATAFVETLGKSTRSAFSAAEQNSRLLSGAAALPANGAVVKIVAGSVNDALARVKLPTASVAGKVPIVGVAVTGAQSAYEIVNGADPTRTVIVNGGSLAAGTAGGAAASAALAAVGVAGGPATIIVIGVGFAVSWGVGRYLDSHVPG